MDVALAAAQQSDGKDAERGVERRDERDDTADGHHDAAGAHYEVFARRWIDEKLRTRQGNSRPEERQKRQQKMRAARPDGRRTVSSGLGRDRQVGENR